MNKQEIDLMVENFLKPTKGIKNKELSLSELISLVNEVQSTLGPRGLLKEEASSGNSLQYSSIPEISVSELGWSSFDDEKREVPSEQRAALQQYLQNIQGDTFGEKIKSINDFFRMSPEELEKSQLISADNNSSKIQKLISYLVFYKALTVIITNFNAASAGFAFESFIAVLLGGQQVPTGQGTIADLWTGDNVPMSLKLYSQSSVDVGGSFTDLCNDLIKPKKPENPFIRYLIATKDLKGEKLNLEGVISLYQFDIDLNNVMDIMVQTSIHSKDAIRLPKPSEQPKDVSEPTVDMEQQPAPASLSSEQGVQPVAVEEPLMEKKGGKKASAEPKVKIEYYTPQESVAIYSGMDEQQKKDALKTTKGYVEVQQFSMTKQNIFTVISGIKPSRKRGAQNPDPKIGEIVVGRKNIEVTINRIASLINASVFDIFSSLKNLTTNINSYFATGMKDDNLADEAQTAAQNIDKKTEEIQTQSKT
jgi:hypothetical protein